MVRGYLQNKELVGDTWSPAATFKYFLVDANKHKERVHHLYLIGASFKAKVKNRVFVELESRYTY